LLFAFQADLYKSTNVKSFNIVFVCVDSCSIGLQCFIMVINMTCSTQRSKRNMFSSGSRWNQARNDSIESRYEWDEPPSKHHSTTRVSPCFPAPSPSTLQKRNNNMTISHYTLYTLFVRKGWVAIRPTTEK